MVLRENALANIGLKYKCEALYLSNENFIQLLCM